MGYDLTSHDGASFGFSSPMWHELQVIAKHWGWKPEGTYKLKCEDIFWENGVIELGVLHGSYFGNSGQVVSKSDALAWSDALYKSLCDSEFETKVRQLHAENSANIESSGSNAVVLSIWEFDEPQYRTMLSNFISFCKRGSFVIT